VLAPDVLGLPAPRLVITLRPRPKAARRCSRRCAIVADVRDTTERLVRDVPLNRRRRHSSLGYRTPSEFEEEVLKAG
jgi:hypothetical protein